MRFFQDDQRYPTLTRFSGTETPAQELVGCLVQVAVGASAAELVTWRHLYEIAWSRAQAQVAQVECSGRSSYPGCHLN